MISLRRLLNMLLNIPYIRYKVEIGFSSGNKIRMWVYDISWTADKSKLNYRKCYGNMSFKLDNVEYLLVLDCKGFLKYE